MLAEVQLVGILLLVGLLGGGPILFVFRKSGPEDTEFASAGCCETSSTSR